MINTTYNNRRSTGNALHGQSEVGLGWRQLAQRKADVPNRHLQLGVALRLQNEVQGVTSMRCGKVQRDATLHLPHWSHCIACGGQK